MKVINNKKDELELEIDELALAEIIVDRLNKEKDVKFAGYKQEHPGENKCKIYIKAKEPAKNLKKVIGKIKKDIDEIKKSIKKAK